MAKWGKCDFKQLVRVRDKLERLQVSDLEKLVIELTNEIAARLLRKIIKRTPVGQYSKGSGKVGGTLRRGWNIGEITQAGNTYEVEIINPIIYASYVEFGHRTRNHKGWVRGRFMMTISEKEVQQFAHKLIEKRIMEYLEWCLSDK